jgi:hypothetical protein
MDTGLQPNLYAEQKGQIVDDDFLKSSRAILDEQNQIEKIVEEENRLQKLLGGDNALSQISEEAKRHFTGADTIARHIKHLDRDRLGFLSASIIGDAIKAVEKQNNWHKNIVGKLAEINSIGAVFAKHSERVALTKPIWAAQIGYTDRFSSIQRAMASMKSPWLDTLHASRSIRGFAELQAIGYALNSAPSFGIQFTDSLRLDLGDWRDQITWPEQIFTDPVARTEFYVERGLNTELTDFPETAFYESLSIAGVTREPPALVARYGPPVILMSSSEDEKAFGRTNAAHDWLQRLETQLRRFIEEVMTKAFGTNWAKARLPNGMYEKWMGKKEGAEKDGGKQWPLIAYADFTEYPLVICRSDNWKEVFAPFFLRQESVKESFQRLHPLRIGTMHARPITQDDEILLYVEVQRLAKACRFTA